MRRVFFWVLIAGVAAAGGAAGLSHFSGAKPAAASARFRTGVVKRGDVTQIVNSTGTVQPVQSVQVGSFVSGPVQEVFVNFNDKVKAGQLLAKIDPRLYKSTLAHEEASLANSKAALVRVEALLEQAVNDEKRALQLRPTNAIAETDLDGYVANRKSLEAQVELAKASIKECEANLAMAKTNLEFTDIKSPVDGVVTDRKVDPGQTVAAAFQTPTMFIVAPELERKVYVWASVDEADVGLIREAKEAEQPVTFTVDAYPNDVFSGTIQQIRLNPTTVQNVVTYTVIVEAPNPGFKLLPGLTANLTFQIKKHPQVLVVPNNALRFRPRVEYVREQDRVILEGESLDGTVADSGATNAAATARSRNQKIIWVQDGEWLAAVKVVTGIGDKNVTEIVTDNVKEGQEIVLGVKVANK